LKCAFTKSNAAKSPTRSYSSVDPRKSVKMKVELSRQWWIDGLAEQKEQRSSFTGGGCGGHLQPEAKSFPKVLLS
jgi:hypothetical protein